MRTDVPHPRTGSPAPPEELSWDDPVALNAESRAPKDDEKVKGFLFRYHCDPACTARLAPEMQMLVRRYDSVKADALCRECSTALVPSSQSSVVRQLREAERTLHRMRGKSSDGPMPREMVQCRAIRFEAENAVSVHPDAQPLADRVADLAGEVMASLRDAMISYDSRR